MKKPAAIILVAVILLVAALLGGCGKKNATIPKPSPDKDTTPVTVTGSITAVRNGNDIHVECETDLMDGVFLKISIDSYNGDQLDKKIIVKDGDKFSADFVAEEDWPETIYASLTCTPTGMGKQKTDVKETYGRKFQNMAGENVVWNTEGNAFVVQCPVE